jgi:protein-S-isoprenylcysteine O-methyltransferase
MEYWLETMMFGTYKFSSTFISLGISFLVIGQLIRSLAMWTCGESFSHMVQDQRPENHRLVKHGIYSVFRHPSYFGWFIWSAGTQLLLCNPICFVFYIYSSWTFFAHRIAYEEELLVQFYGNDYIEYAKSTIIGIPFVPSAYSPNYFKSFFSSKVHGT